MPEFIHGLALCEAFFEEAARPILARDFSPLRYTAGLVGYGSDVLGYDDAVSTDHMWGPRFYLFLDEEGMRRRGDLERAFARKLPYTYRGYSVHFSPPDPDDGGVRHPAYRDSGDVSPLIFYDTPQGFLREYLGVCGADGLGDADWLSLSEHRLLGLTAGKLFADGLGFEAERRKFRYFPENVRLYKIASNWAVLAQEQAFVKRCGARGDDVGARLILARMVQRLMNLCFLYCGVYAPYSKWFGTAFSRLPVDPAIGEEIAAALAAGDVARREERLVRAQALVGRLHNESGLTPPVGLRAGRYFGRDIRVIYADEFADAAALRLRGTALENAPPLRHAQRGGEFDRSRGRAAAQGKNTGSVSVNSERQSKTPAERFPPALRLSSWRADSVHPFSAHSSFSPFPAGGRAMVKTVPRAPLSTAIFPRCAVTIASAMASPRP